MGTKIPFMSLSCPTLQGGAFGVTLLVGDPSIPTAHQYVLGEVVLPAVAAGASSAPGVRTSSFQPLNNLKPEIEHLHVSGHSWESY